MPAGPTAGTDYTRSARAERVTAVLRRAFPASGALKAALLELQPALRPGLADEADYPAESEAFISGAAGLIHALADYWRTDSEEVDLDTAAWRDHALAVGCTAAAVACYCRDEINPADAFAAGVLHDVGKLALKRLFPKAAVRAGHNGKLETSRCGQERACWGIDHAGAGRVLLVEWDAPEAWADAVGLHHQPPVVIAEAALLPALAMVVAAANHFVHADNHAPLRLEDSEDLDQLGTRLGLGVDRDEVRREAREIRQAIEAGGDAPAARPASAPVPVEAPAFDDASSADDPWLDALTQFTALLPHGGETSAIVAAGARACGLAWSRTVVLLAPSRERVMLACWDGRQARTVVMPGNPMLGSCSEDDIRALAYAQFADILSRKTLDAHLLTAGGRWIGICVEADPISAALPSRAPSASCFAATLAWALECARAREQAIRAADCVAAAAHALHESRGEARYSSSVASIAEMAAGAAHELNNPLAVIAGRAQMLRRLVRDEELDRQLALIDEQARRASQIVADLVQFAKPETPQPARIQLGAWVQQLCQHWQTRSSLESGRIIIQLADPGVCVRADPAQLDEAANAVIANAVEAMSPLTACLIINSPARPSDEHVVVTFGDNGCGMTPEVLRHACDPFYSHRPAGRGRGMGLSRAARLLQVNGGRLTIESAPDVGTRVSFILPVAR